MAPPAGERPIAAARRLLDLLAPFPGRAEFAIRLALICALTALDVQVYQTPEPALTIYVAFFVIKPDRVTSVVVSVVMALLITIIIGVVLLISMVVLDQPLWRVTTIALLSFGLLFAASASKLKPVGSIIALITGYALDVLGTVHMGEIATRALLYAWLFVVIPAGISIVVNLLIGPSPRRLAERALAHRLRLAATLLRGSDEKTRHAFSECLHEGPAEIPAWLKLAGAERTANAVDLAALAQSARSTCALLSLIELVVRTSDVSAAAGREELATCLGEMADIFERGGYPLDIAFAPNLAPGASTAAIASFEAIQGILTTFAVAPAPEPQPAAKAKAGFFVADAFTNPIHVHYALKATAAAMFCYVAYSLLDWPGIHTCFITCYIVSLGTTAETIEKLTLRILGCLTGAALGIAAIVFVMPSVTSIGVLIAIVGGGALASGWIAAGSPRISYVGFQLAFAFFLCVVQGSGPAFDMTTARDRVIGVLFGNLVVALIFTQVWPVSVASRIDPAIAALLRKLASLTREAGNSKRWALVAETQAALGAVDQDVALTHYEPLSIRPVDTWTKCRERILAAITACHGPLLLAGGPDHRTNRSVADRLDRSADALDGRRPTPEPPGDVAQSQDDHGVATDTGQDDMVETALIRLEQAVACVNQEASDGTAGYVAA